MFNRMIGGGKYGLKVAVALSAIWIGCSATRSMAADDDAPSRPATLPAIYTPTDTEVAKMREAMTLARKPDLQKSIEILDELMEAHPGWVEIYVARAQVLLLDQDPGLAMKSYEVALELDPRNHEAMYGLSLSLVQLDKYPEAVKSIDQLLAIYPSDGRAAILRARALVEDQQFTAANTFINTVLSSVKGADRKDFLAALSPLQIRAANYEGAEKAATEWIAAAPVAAAYATRAEARRNLKKLDEALQDIAAGFKANQGRPTYALMFTSAQVLLDRGDATAAILQLTDLLELKPGDVAVERELDRAVTARRARIATAKTDSEKELVSKLDALENVERIVQWNLRRAIGDERTSKVRKELYRAASKGEDPPYSSYNEGRSLYPSPDFYAAHADFQWFFDLNTPASAIISNADRAGLTARDYRIAAALAAVRWARLAPEGSLLKSQIEGYLDWADFQQHVKDDALTERDKLLVKGHTLEGSGDYWGAVQAYTAAARLKDSSFVGPSYVLQQRIVKNPAKFRKAADEAMRQVDDAISRNDSKRALAVSIEFMNVTSSCAESLVARSKAQRAAGDKARAEELLVEALEKDGLCADAHLIRAIDLEQAGKLEPAMFEYNFAARGQEKPSADDPPAVAVAIAARVRLEKSKDLAALWRIYSDKANAAYKSRAWSEAVALATRLTFGFQNPEAAAFGIAGNASKYLFRYEDAARLLAHALEIDPKLPLHSLAAEALESIGNWRQAAEEYTKAIEKEPDYRQFYTARGKVLMELEEFADAAADFKIATAKGDLSTDTKMNLAECLSHDDPAAATAIYKQVVEMPKMDDMFGGDSRNVERARARLYLLQTAPANAK